MQDFDLEPFAPPRAPVGSSIPKKKTGTSVPDGNPWLTIWTRPRGTIRGIVNSDPSRGVALLSIIYGISSTLSNAMQKDAGDVLSLPALLAVALIGGSLGGLLWNLIFGALVRWTGSWLGGVATPEESRAAMAWSVVPHAVNLGLMAVLIAVLGIDAFRSTGLVGAGPGAGILLIAVGLAQVVLAVWTAFLMIKCVAEVHRFSAWKGLGALVLVVVVFVGFLLLLAVLVIAAAAVLKVGV